MTYHAATIKDDLRTLPKLPGWVTSQRAETAEDVAFRSGAALAHLHLVVAQADVPYALSRKRLVLRAVEVCVGFSGRSKRAGALCDEVRLLGPGEMPWV